MEKELLNSELDNASGYLNRILQVASRYGHLGRHPGLVANTSDLYLDLIQILSQNLFTPRFEEIDLAEIPIEKKVAPLLKTIQSLVDLPLEPTQLTSIVTTTINKLYHYAFLLHQVVFNLTHLEIEFPRINLVRMTPTTQGIPQFSLPLEAVLEANKQQLSPLTSLKKKREELYKDWLYQGHQFLLHDEIEKAHSCFQKAQNLQKTAEVLTLLAWTYSLQKNLDHAKKLCLEAIRLDPDYGPPYNDLGNYLLAEDNVEEALQWFELAKKAKNYQNREYPYINSARAYIGQKRYGKALNEFSYALTLTPYNQELQDTVTQIRNRVENRELIDDHF